MSTSEILARKLTGLLFGLKQGTKSVTDVLPSLNKLKQANALLYEDFEKKYIEIMAKRSEQRQAA